MQRLFSMAAGSHRNQSSCRVSLMLVSFTLESWHSLANGKRPFTGLLRPGTRPPLWRSHHKVISWHSFSAPANGGHPSVLPKTAGGAARRVNMALIQGPAPAILEPLYRPCRSALALRRRALRNRRKAAASLRETPFTPLNFSCMLRHFLCHGRGTHERPAQIRSRRNTNP